MNERLSWSEAEAVVRAYRAEHRMSSNVDIATLAKTLGTSPTEVRRLAGLKRRFVDRSGALSAVLTSAAVALVPSLASPPFFGRNPLVALRPEQAPLDQNLTITQVEIDPDGSARLHNLDFDGDPRPNAIWTYPSDEQIQLAPPDGKTL